MGMTREEKVTKDYIQTMLAKQGYVTYANIFSNFDLNLTNNPNVVGFMEPSKGRIVVNRNLQANQVSVIIRHEILHFFLEHEQRLVNKLAKKLGFDPDNLSLDQLENIKRELYKNKTFNIAGDYEISNRGYTDEDKEQVRNIELNGQILSGLVTEDKHPDWVDWTLEDMYDALNAERDKQKEQQKQQNQDQNKDDSNDNNSTDDSDSSGDSGNDNSSGDDDSEDNSSNGESSDSSSDGDNDSDDSDSNGDSGVNDDSLDNSDNSSNSNSSDSSDSNDNTSDSDNNSNGKSQDNSDDSESSKDSSETSGGGNDDSKSNSKSKSRSKDTKTQDEKDFDKSPQIGEIPDDDELAKEDEERNAQIEQEREEDSENDEQSGEGDSEGSGTSEEDKEQARLERIRKILNDKDVAQQITGETDAQVSRSRSATAARNAKKYRNTPIKKFEDSLNKFIKNEVGDERNATWRRFNKNYAGSGILRPGRATVKNKNIPLINVYFDRSGSWDASKTQVGEQAIGTLNNYVRKKQIKIDLYYFANKVSDHDDYSSLGGGGTKGEPILQHIKQTRPDNVIIMTDSDIMDCTSTVQVPGAVWFLWKDGVSQNLQQHLSGKTQTNNYEI